tara:strand:+ start:1445 stop:4486 length:3042 start_codon:yes stop_codon:yes gene_type:complete
MAECTLFGGLVPNVYIDKVFIEESQVDTNNDGIIDLQTPKITINLRLVDQLSANGTYSLLEDALEVQLKIGKASVSTINLKSYFKVWCVISDSQTLTDNLEAIFEQGGVQGMNSGNFQWSNYIETGKYESKTLTHFVSTYTNPDGSIELNTPYAFDLGGNQALEHLSIFAYVQLDTDLLEADFNIDLPEEFTNIVGRFEQEIVIKNSVVNPALRAYLTEGGAIWNGPIHLIDPMIFGGSGPPVYMEGSSHRLEAHGTLTKTEFAINNVQDFRIRDEINVLVAEFEALTTLQNSFPGQKDIFDRLSSGNSYFSELSITKDERRSTRFLFAFDYGKYILENSKYSTLISRMSETAKTQIIKNSQITQFIMSKKQVKRIPARNRLGSPVQNSILNDETMETPVILSLDDKSVNEINLILTDQTTTSDSLVRYFTGVDIGAGSKSDGIFQYVIDIEILDGFIPIMQSLYNNMLKANADYQKYVALAQIPNVYDDTSRKFTTQGQAIMASALTWTWAPGTGAAPSAPLVDLEAVIDMYLDTLNYFVDVGNTPISDYGGLTQKEFYKLKILNLITPTTGGVDGLLIFNNLLPLILSQMNDIMSSEHSSGGVEDTLSNQPSGGTSGFKVQTMRIKEDFDNTIGARFLNDSYIDNISANKIRSFTGLTVYSQSELVNSTQTILPEVVVFSGLSQQELLDQQAEQETSLAQSGINIIFQAEAVQPFSKANAKQAVAANLASKDTGKLQSSANFLGAKSFGVDKNLNTSNLSADAIENKTFDTSIKTDASAMEYNRSFLSELPSKEEALTTSQLKTEVDVLTGFVIPEIEVRWGQQIVSNKYMIRQEKYQIKELGELVVPDVVANSYFLCRQPRQGDIDVIDSFFLVKPSPVPTTFNQNLPNEGLTQDGFVMPATAVATTINQNLPAGGLTQDGFVMPATAVATTINQNLPAGGLTQDGVVLDSASNTAAVLAAKGSSTNNFQVIDLSSGTRRVLNNENVQQNVQKTAVVQTIQAPTDYTRKF